MGHMKRDVYDDLAIEQSAKELFGMNVEIAKVIVRDIEIGKSAKATVFLTKKKQLLCYIDGPTKLLLSDVKKAISRMGLKAELYMPPKGQPDYFDEIGREKFQEVFPGRHDIGDHDIVFYRTLAPYSPALVLVAEVRDGHIYKADSDAHTGWRVAAKFAYRRIKTS